MQVFLELMSLFKIFSLRDSERITKYIDQYLLHAWILKLNIRNEGFFSQAMEFITSRNEGNFKKGSWNIKLQKGNRLRRAIWQFNYRVNRKIVSQISHWGTCYYMSTYSKLQQLFRWYGAFKFVNSLFPCADLEEFNDGLLERS